LNDCIYSIVFNRYYNGNYRINPDDSRRYSVYCRIWRFNNMRVFDHIVDQVLIRKEKEVGDPIQGLFFFVRNIYILYYEE